MRKSLTDRVILGLSLLGIGLAINQAFLISRHVGLLIESTLYMYWLVLALFPVVFLFYPRAGARADGADIWDWLLFVLAMGCSAYFIYFSDSIIMLGWEFLAPVHAQLVSAAMWLLILEAARRTNGLTLAVVVLLFSLYPLMAEQMPGPLMGGSVALPDLMGYHLLSLESVFGIPMRAFASLVIGFIAFGLTLQYTGAGKFFNELAFALVGNIRGGAAHVAVVSSGFQASFSGSVISNVVTSGSVTIPAMKRSGFSASYAGGVEAAASTGGVLTPPIMGTTAFIMATFLSVPYATIALAAAIPAVLFYLGLLLQVDAYAARKKLKAIPRSQLPRIRDALANGWHFLLVFAALIGMLAMQMNESRVPFYAAALLIALNQIKKEHRLGLSGLRDLIVGVGKGLSGIMSVMMAIGMIAGALTVTGVLGTLSTDLVYMAGDNAIVLLFMGALTAFVLGMGMTVSACYIFLAIVLVPALVKAGFNPLATHLFVMYWGMLSFVTPPVAISAFAAAAIAKTSPITIGWQSMRLASVMYFIPFFFVLNPALILQAGPMEVIMSVVAAVLGIAAICWSLQGYVLGVGRIADTLPGVLVRAVLMVGGVVLAMPGNEQLGVTHLETGVTGAVLVILGVMTVWMRPVRVEAPG